MKKSFNILNYFNMRALFMGIGISKLLNQANEYIGISLILGTFLGAVFLSLWRFELKKTWVNVIVASFFFVTGLIILLNMITTMYLTEMPRFMVGIPMIILILYILSKREIIIFRISNILIVLNLLLFVMSTFMLISYFRLDNFIYTGTPLQNIFTSAIEYAMLSTLPVLMTKTKKYADYSLLKTYLFSSLTMSVLFLLTYGILGQNLVNIYRYPEYVILKKITIMDFLENIENIVSFMWIFDIFIFLLCNGLVIKDNLPKPNLVYLILPLLLLLTSYISRFYTLIIFLYKNIAYFLLAVLIILLIFNKISLKRAHSRQ